MTHVFILVKKLFFLQLYDFKCNMNVTKKIEKTETDYMRKILVVLVVEHKLPKLCHCPNPASYI